VFKKTYAAALLVNTSLPGTTLVGAWVSGANQNGLGAQSSDGNWSVKPTVPASFNVHKRGSNLNAFNKVNGEDGIWMATVQNKSVKGLTLTGTVYYAANLMDNIHQKMDEMDGEPLLDEHFTGDAATIIWGDATYVNPDTYGLIVGVQAGNVDVGNDLESTTAFGAKIGAKINMFSLLAAYSSVDEGETGVFNVGGVKTPLYTQMILNQGFIAKNADTILLKGVVKALGGKFIAQYGMTTQNDRIIDADLGLIDDLDYNEFDFIYKTKVWNDSTTLLAAYVNQDFDLKDDSNNVIRFWARYNF
jgi:hypothetical protein